MYSKLGDVVLELSQHRLELVVGDDGAVEPSRYLSAPLPLIQLAQDGEGVVIERLHFHVYLLKDGQLKRLIVQGRIGCGVDEEQVSKVCRVERGNQSFDLLESDVLKRYHLDALTVDTVQKVLDPLLAVDFDPDGDRGKRGRRQLRDIYHGCRAA